MSNNGGRSVKAKISIITLGVADMARSLRFYRDGLGFPAPADADGTTHVLFDMDGTRLALFPWDELAKDAGVDGASAGFRGVTLARNEPSPEAVDATFAEALAAGATAVKPPAPVFWGGYSGYFADPDGHLWEVAHNPFDDLT